MSRPIGEKSLHNQIERMRAVPPEQARRLVGFAWQCVHGTPLSGGRTPVGHLRGRSRLLDALLTVGCWLKGESVERQLRSMHDEVFEAALGEGRFESDMIGLRAACWSVFELYQAAVAAQAGETHTVARKAAWSAFLAVRSGDGEAIPEALAFQEGLFQEMFDYQATADARRNSASMG
jgi:hypothetical protein